MEHKRCELQALRMRYARDGRAPACSDTNTSSCCVDTRGPDGAGAALGERTVYSIHCDHDIARLYIVSVSIAHRQHQHLAAGPAGCAGGGRARTPVPDSCQWSCSWGPQAQTQTVSKCPSVNWAVLIFSDFFLIFQNTNYTNFI